MSALVINLTLVLALLGICSAAWLTVPKCKLSDSKCIKSSAAAALPTVVAGIPELGTQSLDPVRFSIVNINIAGLHMILKDVDIIGIKNAHIQKIKLDMTKKKLYVVYHNDINIKGKYSASGNLLVLPISGEGNCDIKLKKLVVSLTMPFEVTKNAKGKDTINLQSYTYTYDVADGANFVFTNLFNGNKELSETMLKFMNDNWKILTQEFGKPMIDLTQAEIFKSLKKIFEAQPIDEIALT